MYRTPQGRGMSPRDRLDPRLFERYACNSHMQHKDDDSCDCRVQNNNSCTDYNDSNENNCDTFAAEFNYSLAMVYSPEQSWQNLYCEEEGFMAGTIFRELDKPFYGPKCHGGNY